MDMKRYYWCEGCGVPIYENGRCAECRIRLHEKAVEMRKRMEAKGSKPLPDHIVTHKLKSCSSNNNARWCQIENRWRIPGDCCLACSDSRHNNQITNDSPPQ